MLGNFFHDNETTVMTVVSRINFSLRGGYCVEYCDGYPTSVVMGVVESAEVMHHQPS